MPRRRSTDVVASVWLIISQTCNVRESRVHQPLWTVPENIQQEARPLMGNPVCVWQVGAWPLARREGAQAPLCTAGPIESPGTGRKQDVWHTEGLDTEGEWPQSYHRLTVLMVTPGRTSLHHGRGVRGFSEPIRTYILAVATRLFITFFFMFLHFKSIRITTSITYW